MQTITGFIINLIRYNKRLDSRPRVMRMLVQVIGICNRRREKYYWLNEACCLYIYICSNNLNYRHEALDILMA